jgi:thiamine-monophosphate kinase
MMNEFELIQNYFKSLPTPRGDVVIGIGDDAACLRVPQGCSVLVSTDTLVSGVHFLPTWNAYDIAYRALMVNLSDLAAMAAEPCWFLLALTLPTVDEAWLESFALGMSDVIQSFGIALVGGDTTQGPLSITITMMGLAPVDKALKRSGAQPGDEIFVSGELGAAALAVETLNENNHPMAMEKLLHPKARVDLIPYLRQYATSAIDISDGLSADLNHLCVASNVGACLMQDQIPLHASLELALHGGDDYELCFTVPAEKKKQLTKDLKQKGLKCYPIGVIEEEKGLRIEDADGNRQTLIPKGYRHF